MLQGQYVPKLVNGFGLRLYHGVMPDNPFQMLIKENKIPDILPKVSVLSQLGFSCSKPKGPLQVQTT